MFTPTTNTSSTLADKLRIVYPALKHGTDYTLAPDGASLSTWTPRQSSLVHPTLAQIDNAWRATQPAISIDTASFIARIPIEVWSKVAAARSMDTLDGHTLDQGMCRLLAGPTVNAADKDLNTALDKLVAGGVLTADEKAQILAF